jgi:hypothetical protein
MARHGCSTLWLAVPFRGGIAPQHAMSRFSGIFAGGVPLYAACPDAVLLSQPDPVWQEAQRLPANRETPCLFAGLVGHRQEGQGVSGPLCYQTFKLNVRPERR